MVAVDCLCQSAMKKCILNIELVHWPRARESQKDNSAHCSRLHHWTRSLIIVHTRTLSEPPNDPTRLIALQSNISPSFDRPNPLASHHIATRKTRHKVPSLVGKKASILLFHRMTPVRICQPHEPTSGSERVAAPPQCRREPATEEPLLPAGSPWDGCDEDLDG
jgi:hypothetical protein